MATAASQPTHPLHTLREHVRSGAKNRPGIYRMLADRGVVIYVGKSKRVRTRLMGYFRAREHEKAWRIVREAAAIEWEYAPSEFASLLRELELIKLYRPPYNVHQKRDRAHSFLRLSGGPAPKIHLVRRVSEEPGTYFGPFRGGQRIAAAVRELNDVLQLRDCRQATPIHFGDQDDLFGAELTPLCPRFELQRCAAPCAARCTEAEYLGRIAQARAFLNGASDQPLQELSARMAAAAERMEFEHAAAVRDRIGRLEMLRAEFQRLRETVERLTFLYAVPGTEGDHRVYAIRSGSVRASFPAPRSSRDRERMLKKVEPLFRDPEPVVEISSRKRAEEMLLVAHWFRTRPDELPRAYGTDRWGELPLAGQLDRLSA